MSSAPAFRIVSSVEDFDRPLRFERRQAHRHTASGRVTAVCLGPETDAPERRMQIMTFQLHDASATGLGAFTEKPVPLGSRLELMASGNASVGVNGRAGHVVHCEPVDGLYEIGIRLEALSTHAA